jgi:hypothetical protein
MLWIVQASRHLGSNNRKRERERLLASGGSEIQQTAPSADTMSLWAGSWVVFALGVREPARTFEK